MVYKKGFTIVELLIVIVIVGILAAITLVSYTGINKRATVVSLQSDLDNAAKQLKMDQIIDDNGDFPASLVDANDSKGLARSPMTDYQYQVDNTSNPKSFCLTATNGDTHYKITNDSYPVEGVCLNYGLMLDLDAGNPDSYSLLQDNTTWKDLSGNGNDGSLISGVGYTTDGGGALRFDGIDDKVSTNFGPRLNDYSVAIWFKDDNSGTYGRLVDKSYTSGFWIGRNSSSVNSWGGGILEASPPHGIFLNLTDGNWNFLVSERQGSVHRLYGNGSANTVSNTVSSAALDGTTIAIGGWSSGSQQWFTGDIAVVKVYDRAISSVEVQQLFDDSKSIFGY